MLTDVSRMRLTCEHQLNGPAFGRKDSRQPIEIVKNELRTLVPGEATRKPDRQSRGIEQGTGRNHARRADVLMSPALTRTLADEAQQIIAEREPYLPQFFIGLCQDIVPDLRVIGHVAPARRAYGELGQFAGKHVGRCTAVGDDESGRLEPRAGAIAFATCRSSPRDGVC